MIEKKLYLEMEAAGLRFRTFKVEHLEEIKEEFKNLAAQGLLDEEFYKANLTNFDFNGSNALKNAKSVIIIAAPQRKSIAEFTHKGKVIEAVLPPTYLHPGISRRIANLLNDVLVENNYNLARPILPLKLLAVRSGLGQYGRNNICYTPGLGSFIRLAAFVTDYDFKEDCWGEAEVMKSCSTCTACVESCPTAAIDRNRFLIHAHNCLTNLNEYETPIPEWVEPHWHDSIVGCMKCQVACPHNGELIDLIDERIHFNEDETNMIVEGKDFDGLPEETKDKISYAGLEVYYKVLPRNLMLLVNQAK